MRFRCSQMENLTTSTSEKKGDSLVVSLSKFHDIPIECPSAPNRRPQHSSSLRFNPFTPKNREWSSSNFPCSLTRNITSHSMKSFSWLTHRWKDYYTTIVTTSLIHFSLKGWENVILELGSKRVNAHGGTPNSVQTSLIGIGYCQWQATSLATFPLVLQECLQSDTNYISLISDPHCIDTLVHWCIYFSALLKGSPTHRVAAWQGSNAVAPQQGFNSSLIVCLECLSLRPSISAYFVF